MLQHSKVRSNVEHSFMHYLTLFNLMECMDAVNAGFSFRTNARGSVNVYQYCPEDPHGPPRSHTQHKLHVHQKAIINGVIRVRHG